MKRKKPKNQSSSRITLPIEAISLEVLQGMVEQNLVKNEIPFEVLADHYPSLLSGWYPGYPSTPRRMDKNDPIPCRGYIKCDQVTLSSAFGPPMGPIDFAKGADLEEGEYEIWLKCDDDQYFIFIASKI
jgi:hypothetical protein